MIGGLLIKKWEKMGIYEYDWVLADIELESTKNFQVKIKYDLNQFGKLYFLT
jgi:hypothetical protein